MPYLSSLKIISKCNAKYANYNSELDSQSMLITTEHIACLDVTSTKKWKGKVLSIKQKA